MVCSSLCDEPLTDEERTTPSAEAAATAQKLNRQWIGIDITHLSIAFQKYRLKDSFGLEPGARTLLSATSLPAASSVEQAPTPFGSEAPVRTGVSALHYRIIGEPEDLDGAVGKGFYHSTGWNRDAASTSCKLLFVGWLLGA